MHGRVWISCNIRWESCFCRLSLDLLRSTTGGTVYPCPVAGCEKTFNKAYIIDRFYKQLDDTLHTEYFHQRNTHMCPFGCPEGFLNDFALYRHIQQSWCKESDTLIYDIKTRTQCDDGSFLPVDIMDVLDHIEDNHSALVARIRYVCEKCNAMMPALRWKVASKT